MITRSKPRHCNEDSRKDAETLRWTKTKSARKSWTLRFKCIEVVVELKSVEKYNKVHSKQLLTHIKLADKRLGLLLNFGAVFMKDGIERIVNGLKE